jgi:Fe-S oxidoreductase
MSDFSNTIRKTNAFYCLDCGKCTAVCPIAQVNSRYSPRRMVGRSTQKSYDEVFQDPRVWACLTCKGCEETCPADVDYTGLTLNLRSQAADDGQQARCSHGGAIQSLMRIMTEPNLKQNRLDWVGSDLKTAETGEILYFVGCAPYLDVLFSELGAKTIESAKSAIKLLNAIGITPALMSDERCCGHDLLWSGDQQNFRKLAQHNVEAIRESGAKKVVFSCPECYRTVKDDYAQLVGGLGFDTAHISEVIAEKVDSGELIFPTDSRDQTVTYQDPCRLGRHLGKYEAPRKIMDSVPGIALNEMANHGKKAICCGVSNWMNCTTHSKRIQVERLRQAKATGADTLVTACPKCEIHLRCAMKDPNLGAEISLDIKDVATLAAESLV